MARGMPLVWCDIKHLAWPQDVGDSGDRKLEGPAEEQRPLLVQMRMIRDDGTGRDVDSPLSNMVRVEIAAEVAWRDLARCNGREVE